MAKVTLRDEYGFVRHEFVSDPVRDILVIIAIATLLWWLL